MTKETMTVHMALAELKTIEKRIEKAIAAITPIAVKENASVNVNGVSIDDYTNATKSEEQKALDLIARQNAMKAALYQYNTTKEIEVAGQKMTIAQALWMKEHGMGRKKALLSHYEAAYAAANKALIKFNGDELNKAAEHAADVNVGNKENSKGREYLDTVDDYKERHRMVFVDPLRLKSRIEELSEEIEKFSAEVDARIQTANAVTEIIVEY